jgi:hypothetical protein
LLGGELFSAAYFISGRTNNASVIPFTPGNYILPQDWLERLPSHFNDFGDGSA